jgi:N-acetylmuramoyl-L-alanine amidase
MLKGMNIQRALLTVNPFSRPGKKLSGVKAIVIHWVANAGSTVKQNRDYFESLKTQSLNDASAR